MYSMVRSGLSVVLGRGEKAKGQGGQGQPKAKGQGGQGLAKDLESEVAAWRATADTEYSTESVEEVMELDDDDRLDGAPKRVRQLRARPRPRVFKAMGLLKSTAFVDLPGYRNSNATQDHMAQRFSAHTGPGPHFSARDVQRWFNGGAAMAGLQRTFWTLWQPSRQTCQSVWPGCQSWWSPHCEAREWTALGLCVPGPSHL